MSRTVLHMYIPPNPNAYYQELGRGGRDRLPCLSVMCTHPRRSEYCFSENIEEGYDNRKNYWTLE